MNARETSKVADFFIRIIMLFSVILTLIFFTNLYNQTLFTILALFMLIAIIIQGISEIIIARQVREARRQY